MKEIIAIKVINKKAQEVITKIKEENNFNNRYKIKKENEFVFIPIKKISPNIKNLEIVKLKNIEKQKEIGISYKDILAKYFSKKIITQLPSSYDIVGDIIIFDIKKELLTNELIDKLGETIIKIHPTIKVILNKEKEHHGIFRTQDLTWLYGEKRTETIIKENKCILKTDVEKVFYSTRLSTERKRISKQVKENEIIGVFFAGVGPFAIQIAKLSKPKKIIAIELNPIGYKYLLENIKINNVENIVEAVNGDVKEISKKYKDYFDRIPMPLPKSSENFLNDAIFSIKNNGIIHIYNFVSKNDPYKEITEIIKNKEIENKCKIEIIFKKVIRSFSATTVQIVMDLKIKKNNF